MLELEREKNICIQLLIHLEEVIIIVFLCECVFFFIYLVLSFFMMASLRFKLTIILMTI